MPTGQKERPIVFISHAVADRRAAATVASALTEAGFAPWSFNDVYPGENVLLKAGRALDRAEAIVLLLSPAVDTATSRFVLEFAIKGDRFAGRVIPVLLEPTPDLPSILEQMEPIDGRGRRLPQACRALVERLQHPVEV